MKLKRTMAGWAMALGIAAAPLPAAQSFTPPPLFEPPLATRDDPGALTYPGGVGYLADITYKSVAGYRPLKLDLYLPRPAGAPAPLVLWIHGGGF